MIVKDIIKQLTHTQVVLWCLFKYKYHFLCRLNVLDIEPRKMNTNLRNFALIFFLAVLVLLLSHIPYFRNTRRYVNSEIKQHRYDFDFTKIQNRNSIPYLHQKETNPVAETIVKGKGNYILEHPNGLKQNVISWSQYDQDLYIDMLLNKKQKGFFIEIGGYDGETYSNSLFFEKVRDWNGLLVEASPFMYELMLKKDRNCYMVNACISNSVSTMTIVLAGSLSSANATLTEKHRKRIERDNIKNAKHKHWAHTSKQVEVNCYQFNQLMRIIGRNEIDYFSLDVEGAEMHILNSIEWESINIDIFTIETDQFRDQILSFMKGKGYKWMKRLQGDDVFQKIKKFM